jgi:hypothetical protein
MVTQAGNRASAALSDALSERGNLLVLTSSFDSVGSDVCGELLTDAGPAETTIIAVTYRRSTREWIEGWYEHTDTPPARGIVVGVGDGSPADLGDLDAPGRDHWTTETVDNAGDLTGLGIALSDHLDAASGTVRFCFDSLTALLQYNDLKPAFRFCHALTGRVKAADAVGHYHLDPGAHDDQTLATIMGLFDASIEPDGDGDWTVRTR